MTVEGCLIFDASSHLAEGDGKLSEAKALKKVGGAFGFCAGLLGYYATAHYLCEEELCWMIVLLPSAACGGFRPMATADGGRLRLPTESTTASTVFDI